MTVLREPDTSLTARKVAQLESGGIENELSGLSECEDEERHDAQDCDKEEEGCVQEGVIWYRVRSSHRLHLVDSHLA